MNTDLLLPIFVQQRQCFAGRGVQGEREAPQFAHRNSALHHIVCGWDFEGPEAQQKSELEETSAHNM